MLKDDIQNYMDSNYLVQNQRNPAPGASGNGLLFTGEYIITLAQLNQLASVDKWKYTSAVQQCEIQPGLLERNPVAFKNDQEGPDDYYGTAAGSLAADPNIAKRILSYGRNNRVKFWGPIKLRYVYNNINPGTWNKSAWMGRPDLIACLQWAAGEKPPLWRIIYTAIGIAIAGRVGNWDTWILSSLVVYCSKSSWLCRQAAKIWRKRLYKHYPNGVASVLASYFAPVDQPLGEYYVTP